MTTRHMFHPALAVLWAAWLVGISPPAHGDERAGEVAASPNVLWILLDACRADHLSCYGYDRETSPNVDRLAARGVLFERAISQASQTVLSVPSMLTGRYFPTYCFARDSWLAMSRVSPADEKTAAAIFRKRGYATVAVSAHPQIAPASRLAQDFDTVVSVKAGGGKSYGDFSAVGAAFLDWLTHHPDTAFFAYLHTLDTHGPYYANDIPSAWPRHDPDDPTLAGIRPRLRDAYDAGVRFADRHIGELIDRLGVMGRLTDTIIVISADHGELLCEDGATFGHPSWDFRALCPDELFHVPWVMAGPGVPQGLRIDGPAENADILPTILDLAKIESDAHVDGRSWRGAFSAEPDDAGRQRQFARMMATFDCPDAVGALIVMDKHLKYVFDMQTRSSTVFEMPDRFESRKRLPETTPEAAAARNDLESRILPLWRAYDALPRACPNTFFETFGSQALRDRIAPRSAFVDPSANLGPGRLEWVAKLLPGGWKPSIPPSEVSLKAVGGNCWFFENDTDIVSRGWEENAPPLHVRVAAPNGKFRIFLTVFMGERDGHPASAFRVRAGREAKNRTISPEVGWNAFRHVGLGTHAISDGFFDIELDEGDSASWAIARGLLFQKVEAAKSTADSDEMTQQLNALGYVK